MCALMHNEALYWNYHNKHSVACFRKACSMAPEKMAPCSAGEDCLVWSSKSPHLLGRGTLFKDGQSPSALLQEDSARLSSVQSEI